VVDIKRESPDDPLPVNDHPTEPLPPLCADRRRLLQRGLQFASALGAGLMARAAFGGTETAGDSPRRDAPASQPTHGETDRPKKPAGRETSLVARVYSPMVLPDRVPQALLLREMIESAVLEITRAKDADAAWQGLFRPDDVILLKFNQSGRDRIGTSAAFATQLVRSLSHAGIAEDRIIAVEVPPGIPDLAKTRKPDPRWQGRPIRFGRSGEDVFSATLDQATAIINIPFIKHHTRATMTGCLKNLSHGLIRHPARFHAEGCHPAIAEINAVPELRSKVRLHLVDALRVVFDKGAAATDAEIHPHCSVLAGFDPVAMDAVGFSILNEIRSVRGLRPLGADGRVPLQLQLAHRAGLGRYDAAEINESRISI